ncbi:MAG: FtsQ-type POTRA domain-containing protein [Calditrichia bacterium]
MNRQYRLAERKPKEKPPFPSPAFVFSLIVIFAVGYGFYCFGHYLAKDSQMFRLKKVVVQGNRFVDKEDILKLADLKTGVRLFQVIPDSVAGQVLKNPYLQGVSVSRSIPSTVIITVQERKPVAYLVDKDIYMIDAYGIILLKKTQMSLENLPFITGLSVRNLLKNRRPLLDALDLVGKIREVDQSLFQFISEIHMDSEEAPYLYLIRGGATVEIGMDGIYERLFLLSEFIKNSAILNQLEKVKNIDLRYADRIVVTRKS